MATRGKAAAARAAPLDRRDPEGLACLMDAYLEALRSRNYTPSTCQRREEHLRQFIRWCAERDLQRPGQITLPILEAYQRWLYRYRKPDGKPLAFSGQSQRLIAIRQYFKWLCRQHHALFNPASELQLPRETKRLPRDVLSAQEVEQLLGAVDLSEALGVRDRAILEVLYSTGMRRAEVLALDIGDVLVDRAVVFVRQGKGQKDRYTPIGERALSWVDLYLRTVRPSHECSRSEDALFLTVYGERLLAPSFGERVRRLMKTAGLENRGNCHLLRHACATLMLENGADVRYVQEMLGHASLATTQRYTHVSIRQLQAIHQATHPASRKQSGSQ